jgi:hypothetical protein
MGAIGGPGKEFSIGGRTFACTGDGDTRLQLSSVTNERLKNGNKTTRVSKKPAIQGVTGVEIQIDNNRKDKQFLVDIQAGDDQDFWHEWTNGSIASGIGNIEGEIEFDEVNAKATFDVSAETMRLD